MTHGHRKGSGPARPQQLTGDAPRPSPLAAGEAFFPHNIFGCPVAGTPGVPFTPTARNRRRIPAEPRGSRPSPSPFPPLASASHWGPPASLPGMLQPR